MRGLTTSIAIIVLFSVAVAFNSQARTSPVAVGETAPDFTLVDDHGGKITLSDARGKSPVVLVFYRGYW